MAPAVNFTTVAVVFNIECMRFRSPRVELLVNMPKLAPGQQLGQLGRAAARDQSLSAGCGEFLRPRRALRRLACSRRVRGLGDAPVGTFTCDGVMIRRRAVEGLRPIDCPIRRRSRSKTREILGGMYVPVSYTHLTLPTKRIV